MITQAQIDEYRETIADGRMVVHEGRSAHDDDTLDFLIRASGGGEKESKPEGDKEDTDPPGPQAVSNGPGTSVADGVVTDETFGDQERIPQQAAPVTQTTTSAETQATPPTETPKTEPAPSAFDSMSLGTLRDMAVGYGVEKQDAAKMGKADLIAAIEKAQKDE